VSEIKIRGWGAKPRTMLRYIKSGDIFMFQVDDNRYGIGRILIKIDFGHLAEVFDEILRSTELSEEIIRHLKRVNSPIILDSYGLFDKKLEGIGVLLLNKMDFRCLRLTMPIFVMALLIHGKRLMFLVMKNRSLRMRPINYQNTVLREIAM